uniref:Uncharacterized protein n=1 Tax=Nicotiana tabacum TaxID=4097 RepID=A0A1S3XR78_TOBAC|nr:PREDICTED: uncharacterized protein LOC107767639 [Nicotiana tabacum]
MVNYCDRSQLAKDASGSYPKAAYTIDKAATDILFDWLKGLKFPDGFVAITLRMKRLWENYQQILQQQTQTQSDIDQSLAFYQAAGGKKKRRIYGLGYQAKYFYGPNLRASSGSDASLSTPPLNAQLSSMANLDELVMRLIPALTDHMVHVLTDHMLHVLADRVRGLISSPSHMPDNLTHHPSVVSPPIPPPTTNINEVHVSFSDDDLHSPVSQ